MPWRWQLYRGSKVHLTQIPATTKGSGMSTSEQGVKNCRKVKKQVTKSLPVVVFTFGEAGAAKPRKRCSTKT